MRPLTRLASLLVVSAALACGDNTIGNVVVPGVAGTWNLQTVNGQSLPIILSATATDTISLTASRLVLAANTAVSGSFTLTATTRTSISGSATTSTDTTSGSYTLSGTSLSLVSGAQTISGTWNGGNSLSLSEGSTGTFVFARQ